MLAWREFKAELCPHCGVPLVVHETDSVADYGTGFLECTATKAIVQARKARMDSPQGTAEAAAVTGGQPDPETWRQWLHWPKVAGPPEMRPLD